MRLFASAACSSSWLKLGRYCSFAIGRSISIWISFLCMVWCLLSLLTRFGGFCGLGEQQMLQYLSRYNFEWLEIHSKNNFIFFWVKYPHYIHVISTNRNRKFISVFMNHFSAVVFIHFLDVFPFILSKKCCIFFAFIFDLIDESRPKNLPQNKRTILCYEFDLIAFQALRKH